MHIMPRAARKPKPKTELIRPPDTVDLSRQDGESLPGEKGEEPRYVRKRRNAVSLAALRRFGGMSRLKAWRALFPDDPRSDAACRKACAKMEAWAREHFPVDFSDMLSQNHLGLERIAQETQALLNATRYDHVLKKMVPDFRAKNDGVKHLVLINGITPRTIEMIQERRMEQLAPKPTIGVGPKLTKEEWDERWAKADQQSRERFKQIAAQLNEDPRPAAGGTDMIVVGGNGHHQGPEV